MNFDDYCAFNNITYGIAFDIDRHPRGCIFKKGDGYHIMLNGRYDVTSLKKTFIHELLHAEGNHLEKSIHLVDKCEEEVDYIINNLNINWGFA